MYRMQYIKLAGLSSWWDQPYLQLTKYTVLHYTEP